MTLKDYLLSLGFFIDNEYLDEYLELIEKPFNLSGYLEKHHVIPINFYKTADIASTDRYKLEKLAEADVNNKLVLLSYSDHIYAHWLLFKCTTGFLKSANAKAVIFCCNNKKAINFTEDQIKNFIADIKTSKHFWKPSELDTITVAIANSKHGYLDAATLTALSIQLGRTKKAIQGKASAAGIANKLHYWLPTEINWLVNNYSMKTVKECAVYLNRSNAAVISEAHLLELKSSKFWTDAEVTWLIANYCKKTISECCKYLQKSADTIRSKAASLHLVSSYFWTPEQESWLLQNKSYYTWEECARILGRSETSIKHKANSLGIRTTHCIAVRCLETNEVFNSIAEASKKYGAHVVDVLHGKRKTAGGRHFSCINIDEVINNVWYKKK